MSESLPDLAPRIARHLVERSALSIYSIDVTLGLVIAERWPDATSDEVRRAVSIFAEVKQADDNFARFGCQPRFGEPPRL